MAGKIAKMINTILGSSGNPTLQSLTKTKLVLKGINPKNFDAASPDDPVIIDKLAAFAKELNIKL